MTKNIKFFAAIEMMEPGDVFSPNGSNYNEFYMDGLGSLTFENGKPINLHKDHFNLIGDVIKPEPKVLTAEEVAMSVIIEQGCEHSIENQKITIGMEYLDKIAEKGHQNGRLDRDLELKPVFESIKNLEDDNPPSYFKAVKIITEFNNLPPLTKND